MRVSDLKGQVPLMQEGLCGHARRWRGLSSPLGGSPWLSSALAELHCPLGGGYLFCVGPISEEILVYRQHLFFSIQNFVLWKIHILTTVCCVE